MNANQESLPDFQTLQISVSDRIAKVTLNRPQSRNAVDVQMTSENSEQLVAALLGHPHEVRVVLLTGLEQRFAPVTM
ncbi:MAG: hypothetical protein R3C56_00515 [Pirellulaceae bacterium]